MPGDRIDADAEAHYLLEVEGRAWAVGREAWAMRVGLAPPDPVWASRLAHETRHLEDDVAILRRHRIASWGILRRLVWLLTGR